MSTHLLLPDSHGRQSILQKIIDTVPHDFVIAMGDMWDSFGDGPNEASKSAWWVRKQLEENPKYIQLFGNHDCAVMWSDTECRNCSGFTIAKHDAIKKILKPEHWVRFKPFFYIKEGNWLISHSGVSKGLISDFVLDDIERLQTAFDAAIVGLLTDKHHPYFAAGSSRGGSQKHGGIIWEDFNDINPVSQFNQIVGHTRLSQPKIKYREVNSKYLKVKEFNDGMVSPLNPNRLDNGDCVVAIDCDSKYYGLITDGILAIHETPKEFFEDYQKEKDARKLNDFRKMFESMPKLKIEDVPANLTIPMDLLIDE